MTSSRSASERQMTVQGKIDGPLPAGLFQLLVSLVSAPKGRQRLARTKRNFLAAHLKAQEKKNN